MTCVQKWIRIIMSTGSVQLNTRAEPHLKLIYIYTAVLVKIYLKFKFADECFDLSTNGILPFFIELSPFSTNFSLFVPNSYNSVYKICVPFTFRKLVFLLFLFFFYHSSIQSMSKRDIQHAHSWTTILS